MLSENCVSGRRLADLLFHAAYEEKDACKKLWHERRDYIFIYLTYETVGANTRYFHSFKQFAEVACFS